MSQELDDRRRELAARALAKWGPLVQLLKVTEEEGEHIAATARVSSLLAQGKLITSSPVLLAKLAAEIADVEMVLEQQRQILGALGVGVVDMLDRARVAKLDKLERAIEADT